MPHPKFKEIAQKMSHEARRDIFPVVKALEGATQAHLAMEILASLVAASPESGRQEFFRHLERFTPIEH
jgi:hypothetical protein